MPSNNKGSQPHAKQKFMDTPQARGLELLQSVKLHIKPCLCCASAVAMLYTMYKKGSWHDIIHINVTCETKHTGIIAFQHSATKAGKSAIASGSFWHSTD